MTDASRPVLSGTPVLETERLILRAPVAADWPFFRDFTLSERSVFVRPDEVDTARAWRSMGHVVGMWVLRGFGSFVMERKEDRAPLGLCGPWYPIDWPEPEIGWTLWSADAEGKGYAFEAATAARRHAFDNLGWPTAVSYIDPANARSIALAERLGAVRDRDAAFPGNDPCLVYRHPRVV